MDSGHWFSEGLRPQPPKLAQIIIKIQIVAAVVVGAVMWIKNLITGRNKNEGGWRRS